PRSGWVPRSGAAGARGNLPSVRARARPAHVAPGVLDGRRQFGEQMVVMPERSEDPDRAEQIGVTGLDALEQHGDTTALERLHDVAEDPGTGGVDELELRHPEDHHRHALDGADRVFDEVSAEEQWTVETDDGDPL